jgi:alpha-mannosidase
VLRTFQERRLERLLRRVEELRAWRNARQVEIPDWRFTASDGQTLRLTLGDFWPVSEVPVQLAAEATIPAEWAGQPVELELWVGGEGFLRLSTGYQAGLNPMHHRFPVTDKATGGETIGIEVEAVPKGIFGSAIGEPRIERASLVVPEREVRGFERDLTMLGEACVQLGSHEVVPFLLDAVEAALSELADAWPTDSETMISRYVLGYDNGLGRGVEAVPGDWVPEAIDNMRPTQPTWSLPPAPQPLQPLPKAAVDAVKRAVATLNAGLERIKQDYPPVGRLSLTGHAHIDLAWLWPLAETRRKTRRTFSTVLDLMDRYSDFTFNQSSAQAYAWIEEDDPEVFRRITERIGEGRWEPSGGMWLESDCNVTGGEAFARQCVYGQRYFRAHFGVADKVAWLPDVFGFSGQVPQLLRGAEMTGFFTIKLNWNESNPFPYDLFEWEGIDGSRVTAHMFLNPGHGYNGNIVPLDTLGTWRNFRGKTKHSESLLAFGWGDGAGGPTEKMLENYQRIKDFPALPRLRMGQIEQFYAALPRAGLPRWVGELYLELHRGTLTSQARTKALNRAAEHRLIEAETFAALATLGGSPYPGAELEAAWKMLLLNQFHDILPGSSIYEVYQDTIPQLEGVVEEAIRVREEALADISGVEGDDSTAGYVLVANTGLAPRPLRGILQGRTESAAAIAADGTALMTQATPAGLLISDPERMIPGLGWTVVKMADSDGSAPSMENDLRAEASNGGAVIENDQLRVEIGADGTAVRLYDKTNAREALADRANQLWAYVDKPRSWDAWDVDETYERDGEEVGGIEKIEVVAAGPVLAAVRVERRFRESRIVQTYELFTGSRRLDIATEIDWHERQVLLKARFPVAVRSHEATYETMYGAVRRATHRNTSREAAQFEGSAHRFMDMSEPGYGVAILNDAKYGHGAYENVMTLSLLRSPLYPDPLADEGEHRFIYSIFPHAGDWTEAGVAAEAFALNSRLITVPASSDTADGPGFVQVDGTELGFGTLKQAFDGDGLVLRVYEPNGGRGPVTLRFSEPVVAVERVNLLEAPAEGGPIEVTDGGATARFDVRPFEVVSLRIRR